MGVLDEKIAIVTGTSRGVGVGIAHELLRAGHPAGSPTLVIKGATAKPPTSTDIGLIPSDHTSGWAGLRETPCIGQSSQQWRSSSLAAG